MCQKCWLKTETFHQFYLKIEEIQSSVNSIVVENFKCDLKVDDDLENDLKDFDSNYDTEFSTATPWPGKNGLHREIGKKTELSYNVCQWLSSIFPILQTWLTNHLTTLEQIQRTHKMMKNQQCQLSTSKLVYFNS